MARQATKPDARMSPARKVSTWVLWAFMAIAAFLLLAEHRAHILGGWLHLLLGLCVLLLYLNGAHAARLEERGRHDSSEKERP